MWKLICNSVYGKVGGKKNNNNLFQSLLYSLTFCLTSLRMFPPPPLQFIESAEKRMDCRFNRNGDSMMKCATSPLFKGVMICDEGLSISFLKKREVKMKQCWAVGFSILEISKYFMQSSWYEQIVPRLGGWRNCTMILSDTDSFLFQVAGRSTTEILKSLAPIMDFSNFPASHVLHDPSRAKMLGYFKSELPSARINEVVGLKSKTYAISSTPTDVFDLEGREILRKAKGVSSAVKDTLPFEAFKRCVHEVQSVTLEQFNIRSRNHKNQLVKMSKLAFSSFDDKRHLMCNIHSVPYGSVLIPLWKRKGSYPEGYDCPFCFANSPSADLRHVFTGLTPKGHCTYHTGRCSSCGECECGNCYRCWEISQGRCPLCARASCRKELGDTPACSVYVPEMRCKRLPSLLRDRQEDCAGCIDEVEYLEWSDADSYCACRAPDCCPERLVGRMLQERRQTEEEEEEEKRKAGRRKKGKERTKWRAFTC